MLFTNLGQLQNKIAQSLHLGILTCNGVEKHEVLEVGDLPPLPALGHVRRLEKLPRRCQGNAPVKIIKTGLLMLKNTR